MRPAYLNTAVETSTFLAKYCKDAVRPAYSNTAVETFSTSNDSA
ncbi:hypothetical protein [Bathymodiolus thermophilus thioautotrophic gill symbiont]